MLTAVILPPRDKLHPAMLEASRAVADIIGEVLRESRRFGEAGAPAGRPVADLEAVIIAAEGRLAVDPKRHRERVLAAVQGLLSKGCLCMRSNLVWLP